MSTDIIAIVMDDSVITANILSLGSLSDDDKLWAGEVDERGCSAACYRKKTNKNNNNAVTCFHVLREHESE